jgi:dCMP deaminase
MHNGEYAFYLTHCYKHALESKDLSTQNAVIIVDPPYSDCAVGVNNFPPRVGLLPERQERPAKYDYVEHAERAAIYECARRGLSTEGATMYAAWAACADCARAIALSGITTLVRHEPAHMPDHDRWLESITVGDQILTESGVEIISYTEPLPDAPPVLRNGVLFQP